MRSKCSKNSTQNQPSAAQKRYADYVASLGCCECGRPAQIHHPVGATAKHRKVPIGHWWLIPLCDDHHKAIGAGEAFGYESRRDYEKAKHRAITVPLETIKANLGPNRLVNVMIEDFHK